MVRLEQTTMVFLVLTSYFFIGGCERKECETGDTLSCMCGIIQGEMRCIDGRWSDECECPECNCGPHQDCTPQAECVCESGYSSHVTTDGRLVCCDIDGPFSLFCSGHGNPGECLYDPDGRYDCSTLAICDGEWHVCELGEVVDCNARYPYCVQDCPTNSGFPCRCDSSPCDDGSECYLAYEGADHGICLAECSGTSDTTSCSESRWPGLWGFCGVEDETGQPLCLLVCEHEGVSEACPPGLTCSGEGPDFRYCL